MATGFDIRIANKTAIHPKLSSASEEYNKKQPQKRDAYMAAVRDGILPSQNNGGTESETYEFTSMSGKPHNTFNGVHTKYRLPLNSDLLNSKQNGGPDGDLYSQSREHVPHRRAISVEPTHTSYAVATMERVRRDPSRDRRRRNVSGERHRRGVSVDRNAAHDTSMDRRRDKSTDRTRSEINLHKRREISVERGLARDTSVDRTAGDGAVNAKVIRRDPSSDRPALPIESPSVDDDNDSDSDNEAGNYVRLITQPPNPPNAMRQASRQTSSESNSSVFERNTTPRNSNTSKGRSSFAITTSPGYRVNYDEMSPHYSPSSMHHTSQQMYSHHHTSPLPNRHNSPNSVNLSSSSSEANDYVNVNWKPDEPPDEPPPRPPRPTKLDIKHPPNCGSPGPPKTQPRLCRSQAGTPQSNDEMRSRFSPGGSPPPTPHHNKTLLTIDVGEKKPVSTLADNRKPSVPPKPCPGPLHAVPSTPSSSSEFI